MKKLLSHTLLMLTAAEGSVDKLTECCGDQTELKKCDNSPCETGECQDCIWSEWGDYGPCSCVGLVDRYREIATPSNACGKPCNGSKVETKTCIPDCVKAQTPRDCELSEWDEWGDCSKSCDVGQQFRERAVKQNLVHNGMPCNDELKETRACNEKGCNDPQDCSLAPWSEWTACTKTCNGGQQERNRKVNQPARSYGQLCNDTLKELRGCGEEACLGAVNCQWDDWVSWSTCSATCGGGQKSRSRLIVVAPRHGGKLCEANDMSELAACGTQPCHAAVDCVIGDWTPWSACTCSCNGAQSRSRHIETYPSAGGKGCDGSLKEITSCNVGPDHCVELKEEEHLAVPIDCELTDYSPWSSCSVSCGGGNQERSREIRVEPSNTGLPCKDTLSEIRSCNEDDCPSLVVDKGNPIDCIWGEWTEWNECTVECGGGARSRTRDIQQCANKVGKPCSAESAVQMEACNEDVCGSKDCIWAPWSDWAACTCTGLRERHRSVAEHSSSGGKVCSGAKVITESCHSDCEQAPRNCVMGDWEEWSRCSAECGGGERHRRREVAKDEARDGRPCNGYLKEIKACNENPCEKAIDCVMADWSAWTKCTASCDGGQSFRHRDILTYASYGGKACVDELKEIEGCNTHHCGNSQDCEWGDWTEWSACTRTCNGGQRGRDRSISIAPREAGKLCEARTKSEIEPCHTETCEGGCVDAEWGPWDDWGLCSASCGTGYQSRHRIVAQKANHCGKGIEGELADYRNCNDSPCGSDVVDCSVEEWSVWGACSCSCDGIRARSRHIREYARNGGKTCTDSLKEVSGCNEDQCGKHEQVDCEFGPWKPWGLCSSECGGGVQKRYRYIAVEPRGGGKPCRGSLITVQGCNYRPCIKGVDCAWGEWSNWDTCSAQCGGGQKGRYRHITRMPNHEGHPCDAHDNVEIASCNEHTCGQLMYCSWGLWTDWSDCSTTCGSGEMTRRRELVQSREKPDDILDSGVYAQLHSGLEGDTKIQFSVEDASTVFLLAVLITSFSIAASVAACRRISPERINETF